MGGFLCMQLCPVSGSCPCEGRSSPLRAEGQGGWTCTSQILQSVEDSLLLSVHALGPLHTIGKMSSAHHRVCGVILGHHCAGLTRRSHPSKIMLWNKEKPVLFVLHDMNPASHWLCIKSCLRFRSGVKITEHWVQWWGELICIGKNKTADEPWSKPESAQRASQWDVRFLLVLLWFFCS